MCINAGGRAKSKRGSVGIGGANPIRVQSMTTTATTDTESTVVQIERLVMAGCEIVRLTVPRLQDAKNLKNIKEILRQRGIKVPLVADIHFNPEIAQEAVNHVEKVRINPGNFSDSKRFSRRDYTDAEYDAELARIEEVFTPLVLKAKENGVSLRIGTNHGSLSDRIMNRFGDTPEGMVESALEFVRICEKNGFYDIVLSMKSSRPRIMIESYRLLAARMAELNMNYPFHLGVTEAGYGEDGRIKSYIGIGTLLEDGIGDTIRVSLTEDPVEEVPVAFSLARPYQVKFRTKGPFYFSGEREPRNPFGYEKRKSAEVQIGETVLGGSQTVRVFSSLRASEELRLVDETYTGRAAAKQLAELVCVPVLDKQDLENIKLFIQGRKGKKGMPVLGARIWNDLGLAEEAMRHVSFINFNPRNLNEWKALAASAKEKNSFLMIEAGDGKSDDYRIFTGELIAKARICEDMEFRNYWVSLRMPDRSSLIHGLRWLNKEMANRNLFPAIHLHGPGQSMDGHDLLTSLSISLGSPLCDGIGDSVEASADGQEPCRASMTYSILQGSGARSSRVEIISCPSCGRTLYDIIGTAERVRKSVSHLAGLKIAVMGCVVNGPGEMADADFGVVGAGPGKLNLYAGQKCVAQGLDEKGIEAQLIALIKEHGRWAEPGFPLT